MASTCSTMKVRHVNCPRSLSWRKISTSIIFGIPVNNAGEAHGVVIGQQHPGALKEIFRRRRFFGGLDLEQLLAIAQDSRWFTGVRVALNPAGHTFRNFVVLVDTVQLESQACSGRRPARC